MALLFHYFSKSIIDSNDIFLNQRVVFRKYCSNYDSRHFLKNSNCNRIENKFNLDVSGEGIRPYAWSPEGFQRKFFAGGQSRCKGAKPYRGASSTHRAPPGCPKAYHLKYTKTRTTGGALWALPGEPSGTLAAEGALRRNLVGKCVAWPAGFELTTQRQGQPGACR